MISKTFCSAPWFAIRLDWDGKFVPCCQIDPSQSNFCGKKDYSLNDSTVEEYLSSEYVQYIKKSLGNGLQIPECSTCWTKESSGMKSLRQVTNDTVTKNQGNNIDNTWVSLFLKKNSYADHYLISADVKLSNVCNFNCAMCSPHDSSKIFDTWKHHKDEFFVKQILRQRPTYFEDIVKNYQTKRGYQHLKDILSYPIQNLKLLGGEPLLDKDLFKILESVESKKKSQVALHFITNGSQSIVDAYNRLLGYKSVSFSVSLEGIGRVQDYIRDGSDFAEIEKNLLEAKAAGIVVDIHNIIQALSALGIKDLINWGQRHGFSIIFDLLEHPDYLSVSVLSQDLRTKALQGLESEGVINLINSVPFAPEKYAEFKQYIKWFDQDKPIKLANIFPELVS